ncbi:MAG: class I SAM-dependent methyltransferase, partial [Firmicutes bacterium]|nr:class I SAM-dependent methyltransferase [Bacillota bacterium]
MSVKTLLKLNRLFKLPEHPFNTQAAGGTTYAEWEYERAEGGLSLFAPWFAPGDILFRKDVLDLGCGAGGKSVWYAEKYGARVTGIDREERYAEEAEAFARRLGAAEGDVFSRMPGAGSFRFVCADAADTGLPAESFDSIIMSDAFEHLADPEAVLIECGRLLKPGGRIFISFPPYGHPWGEHLTDLIGIP